MPDPLRTETREQIALETAQRLRALAARFGMGYTERFEQDADEFYRERGFLAPGKSVPPELWSTQGEERRQAAWDEWNKGRVAMWTEAVSSAADLLARLSPPSLLTAQPAREPVTFDADEFEHLALMGVSKDGRYRLGDGAAERVLSHARKLVASHLGAVPAREEPSAETPRPEWLRARAAWGDTSPAPSSRETAGLREALLADAMVIALESRGLLASAANSRYETRAVILQTLVVATADLVIEVDENGQVRPLIADTPEHRCGVRGFADSGDVCPGCAAAGRHAALTGDQP
jgi:hypothetical protein